LDNKKKRLNNPDERRKRVHSTLVEFGQMHQLLDTSGGNEKPQQDVDALIKNMVDEKVIITYLFFKNH
jgi:Ca2+-binding EF-hand superfamily protein